MDKYLEAVTRIDSELNKRGNKADGVILLTIREIVNEFKHCPECNGWIGFSDKFCKSCGHKLGADK